MKDYIKIYSHPRSGTHFLEAFLARNFYKDEDLTSSTDIYFGHWSNRKLLEAGEPYHKLFGSHFFPNDLKLGNKNIYIYRDGRAVIASLWNTKFYNKEWDGITFSEFLRKKIDWKGGPGQKYESRYNIVQHWDSHVNEWLKYSKKKDILILSFEDLKRNPENCYNTIFKAFFKKHYYLNIFKKKSIDPIKEKTGISPNSTKIDSWRELFSEEDLEFFYSQISSKKFLYE